MAEAVSSGQEVVNIGVKELLDAGIHFGHQSRRWNPKMKRFIFGKRNGICIIDLTKTLAQLKHAQQFVYETAAQGRDVLFVGTKKQAQEAVKEAATRCGQHYVNNRWLGGTLTNNRHIRVSIKRMQEIEEMEEKGAMENMPMKEVSRLRHELERHHRFLSGLAKMDSMPGAMVVIDVNRESIAVKEANRMGIPVVAIVDTNCDPDPIAYPIPGNDDSSRAVRLVLNVIAEAIIQASAEYTANAAKRQAAKEEAAKERTVSGKAHDASDDHNNYYSLHICPPPLLSKPYPKRRTYLIYNQSHHIGQNCQPAQLEQRPLPRVAFTLGNCNRCHARRGNQHKEHDTEADQRRVSGTQFLAQRLRFLVGFAHGMHNSHLRNKNLLRRKCADHGRADAPIKTQWFNDRLHGMANPPGNGVREFGGLLFLSGKAGIHGLQPREAGHRPQEDRNSQDERSGFLEVQTAPFPHVNEDTLERRHAVRRQLHYKRNRLTLE